MGQWEGSVEWISGEQSGHHIRHWSTSQCEWSSPWHKYILPGAPQTLTLAQPGVGH